MRSDMASTRRALYEALRKRIDRSQQTALGPRTSTPVRPRPSRADLARLQFGTTSRKKARRMRLRTRVGMLGLAAALVGAPGANAGWDLLGGVFSGADGDAVAAADLEGVTTSESAAGMLRFRGNLFQSRPTPSPTPTEEPQQEGAGTEETPAPAPAGSITEILHAAAAEFGLDPGYLVAVADCESSLNPGAVNPAGYHGLFQFDETTWAAYGYGSIYDAAAQARTAARMLAAGMASRWPNCA